MSPQRKCDTVPEQPDVEAARNVDALCQDSPGDDAGDERGDDRGNEKSPELRSKPGGRQRRTDGSDAVEDDQTVEGPGTIKSDRDIGQVEEQEQRRCQSRYDGDEHELCSGPPIARSNAMTPAAAATPARTRKPQRVGHDLREQRRCPRNQVGVARLDTEGSNLQGNRGKRHDVVIAPALDGSEHARGHDRHAERAEDGEAPRQQHLGVGMDQGGHEISFPSGLIVIASLAGKASCLRHTRLCDGSTTP